MRCVIGNYVAKVLWEVLAAPVTYKIVGDLKWVEQESFYDVDTNLTPISPSRTTFGRQRFPSNSLQLRLVTATTTKSTDKHHKEMLKSQQ
jgi:hypothetical protein